MYYSEGWLPQAPIMYTTVTEITDLAVAELPCRILILRPDSGHEIKKTQKLNFGALSWISRNTSYTV